MTKLEDAICAATCGAYETYKEITGGYWLWHSPEHFLQNFVMVRLGKDYWVYSEATRSKIEVDTGHHARGPRPQPNAHYDLVVWHKTLSSLRAVVEVKRCYTTVCSKGLKTDADRIKKAQNGKNGAKDGYLLVYSEMRLKPSGSRLLGVFHGWAESLGLDLVHGAILDEKEADSQGTDWESGYCLLKTL